MRSRAFVLHAAFVAHVWTAVAMTKLLSNSFVFCLNFFQFNAVRASEHDAEFRATSAFKELQTITAMYSIQIITTVHLKIRSGTYVIRSRIRIPKITRVAILNLVIYTTGY